MLNILKYTIKKIDYITHFLKHYLRNFFLQVYASYISIWLFLIYFFYY